MNNVNLIGRLTADPKVTETKETVVARFTVAINRNKDMTDFINCVAFNKTAELIADYFGKGDMIGLTGSLHSGSYDGKDGNRVYFTEVNVNRVYFVGNRKDKVNEGFDRAPFGEDEPDEKPRERKSRRYGK